MRVGVVALTLGFILLSLVRAPIQFIGSFLLVGVGAGLTGFLTIVTEIVRWFERDRVRALAYAAVGMSIGGLATPGVVWVLRNYGWRTTAVASAVVFVLVMLPLASLFGGTPIDRGQSADGIDLAQQGSDRPKGQSPSVVHFTVVEALRTRAFWMISLGHASALLVVGAVTAHLALYLTSEHGYGLQQASFVGAGLTLCQLIGTLGGGALGDRMNKRFVASVAMLGHMIGLLLLTFAVGPWMIWLFVVFHGVSWGIRGPLMGALRADYFGATAFGAIMGYASLIMMLGIVGGPLLAGVLADATGNYRIGFTVLALLSGAGLVFFVLASPPDPPARHSTSAATKF